MPDNTESNQSEPSTAAASEGNHLNVFMLGCMGAGKTSFLAGLGEIAGPNSDLDFKLIHRDKTSATVFNEIREMLRRREWPPPDNATRQAVFDVVHGGRTLRFTWLNYPGEELRLAMASLEFKDKELIQSAFKAADIALVAIDPTRDIHTPITTLPVPDVERRQDALIQAIGQLEHGIGQDHGASKGRKIGLIITKSDLFGSQMDSDSWQDNVLERNRPFLQKIGVEKDNLFAISAVGHTEKDAQGRLIPPTQLQPQGYEALFAWLVGARDALTWQKRLPMIIVSALAAVGLLVVAWMFLQSHLHEIGNAPLGSHFPKSKWIRDLDRESYKQRFEKEINQQRSRLKDGLERSTLEEIRRILELILAHPAADDFIRSRAIELLADVTKQGESSLWTACSSAKDKLEEQSLLIEYVHHYPQGSNIDKATARLTEINVEARVKARNELRPLIVSSQASLQIKVTKLRDYLQRFASQDEQAGLGLAAELAERLLAAGSVRLEIAGFGCDKSTDIGVCVFRNSTMILEVEQNFKELKAFDHNLRDSLRFDLWDYARKNEHMASAPFNIYSELGKCDGRTHLSMPDEKPDWLDNNAWYSLRLSLPSSNGHSEIKPPQLEAYQKYITPGYKW